jgi:molecular chaperone IbpA
MTNSLSIFNQLRPFSVGFDDVFNQFESLFDSDMRMIGTPNYPPYNIVKQDNYKYDIEIALAGFGKKILKWKLKMADLLLSLRNSKIKMVTKLSTKGFQEDRLKELGLSPMT